MKYLLINTGALHLELDTSRPVLRCCPRAADTDDDASRSGAGQPPAERTVHSCAGGKGGAGSVNLEDWESHVLHGKRLINEIEPDEPDPAAANALQEGLGGQFGEMRTMMPYLFQAINFRGPQGKPHSDLLQGIGTEEISHVELIGTTIARLLDGSPRYNGKATDPLDKAGSGGATPLSMALSTSNIHHYLVASQGALPKDAAGNPWSGAYVYNSGNLVLDLLYNLMLESTGRLQKCRIYEMTANKTARSTISYLIVRDQAYENAYAKALETLGVDWGKTAAHPQDQRRALPRGQEAGRAGAAEQAVQLQPRQPVGGRPDLPGRLAVRRRHRSSSPTSRCRRACR